MQAGMLCALVCVCAARVCICVCCARPYLLSLPPPPSSRLLLLALWHIVHEGDGDKEDLDENEVREGLALLEREWGGPSKEKGTSRAGRKRQSFDAAALQGKRSKRSKN